MGEIRLPRLNPTDEEYTLLEWLVADGVTVDAGTAVAVVETSKAAHELVADGAGTLWHRVGAPSTLRPGELVATVAGEHRPQWVVAGDAPGPVAVTGPARRLLAEHGVPESAVRALGKAVVSRSDVEQLVAERSDAERSGAERSGAEPVAPAGAELVILPAAQRRVARTVSASHREIPAAYSVVKVVADRLGRRLRAESAATGYLGLVELVLQAVAARRAGFAPFFGRVVDEGTVAVRPGAHVGVTVDVGRGLYLPVVADADTRPLRDIAADMLRFRRAAARGTFTEAELTGSNIALAVHTDAGIVHARPLVFPGHTCAVSLASTQREVVLRDDGTVTTSEYFHLGLAYDHRVVNGRSAAAFLGAVKADLEAG